MSSDGIEVSEKTDLHFGMSDSIVAEDLLDHPLCPAVRISTNAKRALFSKRHIFAGTVNSSR